MSGVRDGDLGVLNKLASAVAGTALSVSAAAPGEPSAGDGSALWLDPTLEREELREACIAQALLVAGGSLRAPGIHRLIGRPRAARRYVALELARIGRAARERIPHRFERLLKGWTEDLQVVDSRRALDLALDARVEVKELPRHLGTMRPARLTATRLGGGAPSRDGRDRIGEVIQHGEDDELDGSATRVLRVFSSPLSGSAFSDWIARMLGFGRSPGRGTGEDQDGGGASALAGGAQLVSADPGAQAEHIAERSTRVLGLPARPTRFRYPEWNERARRYRMDWTQVHERVPPAASRATRELVGISARAVRRQVASIGLDLGRHRGQPDGDELDVDRVVRSVADRSAGLINVYTAKRRTRRDLALCVLLDISKSTAELSASGSSIFCQQREIAREVMRAADRLGDRTALYAFHSWGRHAVHLQRVKGFDERWGITAHARLDALEPSGLTRMGAAIRHAAFALGRERGHAHRLMLLLTDGFAYDDDYARSYAEADAEKAIAESTEQGIACVCLNVGSTQDDKVLKRLYGAASYLRCADATRAVPALHRLMRSALWRAS